MKFKKILVLSFCFYSISAFSMVIDKETRESLKCSGLFPHFEKKYQIPKDTLHSIALKESGKAHSEHNIKVVWPWSVGVAGKGHYFNNKKEAVTFVKQQLKAGKTNIDIGCMQINLKSHPAAFATVEHAFDPEINVNYGAEFLKIKYNNSQNWHQAIAHYHSMTPEFGTKYQKEVIKIADNMVNYKNNLKKYIFQSKDMAQVNAKDANLQYANFLRPINNNKMIISTKSTHKNSSRWRSNLMVSIPKYKS